jgi:hypothetical protein
VCVDSLARCISRLSKKKRADRCRWPTRSHGAGRGLDPLCPQRADAFRGAGCADRRQHPGVGLYQPDVGVGTSWAFRDHRTMAEVLAEEARHERSRLGGAQARLTYPVHTRWPNPKQPLDRKSPIQVRCEPELWARIPSKAAASHALSAAAIAVLKFWPAIARRLRQRRPDLQSVEPSPEMAVASGQTDTGK